MVSNANRLHCVLHRMVEQEFAILSQSQANAEGVDEWIEHRIDVLEHSSFRRQRRTRGRADVVDDAFTPAADEARFEERASLTNDMLNGDWTRPAFTRVESGCCPG
eukprot:6992101-Lingulodinium_polyedra.AAC.1